MKIGLRLESLQLPLRPALQAAERLGIAGVQLDAAGELAPAQLSQTGRRQFRQLLRSHNVELTALGCPLRHGLNVADSIEERIAHVQKVLDLAVDLGPRCVVVEAGKIDAESASPTPTPTPTQNLLRDALLAIARHGDRVGATLALETGQVAGETVRQFLDRLDTGTLAANFDPANLLMHGFDPYAAIGALQQRIAHVHCKDARLASASRSAAEVLLGHGDLDWLRLLDLLKEADYRGWLTIERENGPLPAAAAAESVSFLRRLVQPGSPP